MAVVRVIRLGWTAAGIATVRRTFEQQIAKSEQVIADCEDRLKELPDYGTLIADGGSNRVTLGIGFVRDAIEARIEQELKRIENMREGVAACDRTLLEGGI